MGTYETDEKMPRVVVRHGADPFGGATTDVDVLEGLGGQHRIVGRALDPSPRLTGRVIRPEGFEQPLLLQPEAVRPARFVRHACVHLALALHGVRETPAEDPGPVAAAAVVGVRLGQVEFPHATDPVPRVPQAGVIGRDMPGQVAVVVEAPQPRGLVSAGQADARGGADRGVGDALREPDPASCQAIQVRRVQERRARSRQVVVAVLVIHDEEEVGASGFRHDCVLFGFS